MKQLFFSVYDGGIQFSLYDRKTGKQDNSPVSPAHVTYNDIVAYFESVKQRVLDDVPPKVTVEQQIQDLHAKLSAGRIKAWVVRPGLMPIYGKIPGR
ncbi:hypothetical protein [Hufsiella ginkgonis]|uniref:Uncharacterized protein n=1 Tax=Hufsiella ginkgonis TaxID=2695274 RepID=A0A7K1XV72_9SPHI|nr:hypothetical protein [Hufsiella ginkgonis]MXV14406.1 hypothetical protein [Hufsiella ginkgonis]